MNIASNMPRTGFMRLFMLGSRYPSGLTDSGFLRFPHPTRYNSIFQQAALERTVEERNAARGRQTYELGKLWISSQYVGVPSTEFLLQHISEFRIKLHKLFLLPQPHPVGRVGNKKAGRCRRG